MSHSRVQQTYRLASAAMKRADECADADDKLFLRTLAERIQELQDEVIEENRLKANRAANENRDWREVFRLSDEGVTAWRTVALVVFSAIKRTAALHVSFPHLDDPAEREIADKLTAKRTRHTPRG